MILVTGGTGLVGAHLLLKLAGENQQIRATCRPSSNLERVREFFLKQHREGEALYNQIDWVQADLNDLPNLEKAFEGIDHVYHCAAMISFDPRDFHELKRVNVRGTANVVNLCIALGIKKLCYVSSIAALSTIKGGQLITEETEWQGASNVYGLSKYLAELEVWRGSQEGVPVVIVNPGIIIGCGFWDQGSGALFRAASKAPNYYPPGGTGVVAINDVVATMVELMNSGIEGERFILVAENLSYKSLLGYLAAGFKHKQPRKRLKFWQLELFWRLDWLRVMLGGKKRKLSRDGAKSLRSQSFYSNAKIRETLPYEFEALAGVIAECCEAYKQERET